MIEVARQCGVFFVPQLLLSLVTLGLVSGYLVARFRGELRSVELPWERPLDQLASLAVTVGLLGSVVYFVKAWGGFSEGGFQIDRIFPALATAYMTTVVGLVTALTAGLGTFVLGMMARRH